MNNGNQLIMLVDHSLCIGCEACTAACKQVYQTTLGLFRTKMTEHATGQYHSGHSAGTTRKIYRKNACLHCTEAACVLSCPTGAIHHNQRGLVVIDERLCITCNYCAKNCPYQAIHYDRPVGVVGKCSLCDARMEEGMEPFCKTVCPAYAVKFGPRDEMVQYAEQRIEDLKYQGYEQANLYGLSEYGGQRVLHLLDETAEQYGLPVDPEIPLSLSMWNAVPVGPAALLAAGAVVGFNILHSRKYEKKAEEVRQKRDSAPYCHIGPGQDEDDDLETMDRDQQE